MAIFHQDVVGYFIWDVPATLVKRTDRRCYDVLLLGGLMVGKGIRGGTCHANHWYVKANNKYMKDYDKNKESSYLQYSDVINLYGWVMSQKPPVNNIEWIKET